MSKKPLFEKLIHILPRDKLNQLSLDYGGQKDPYMASRDHLEASLIAHESHELRQELLEWVERGLGFLRVERR